jgi:transposase
MRDPPAAAWVQHVWADGGYAGRLVAIAKSAWAITGQIVHRPTGQRGFAVLPRRWVVERTLAWMMRRRRLVRDYERLPDTHEAMMKWAMFGLTPNRLAPPPGPETVVRRAKMIISKHLLQGREREGVRSAANAAK